MAEYKITKNEDRPEKSEKYIEIEVSEEVISKHKEKALKNIAARADMDGFRKGHVPPKVIEEKLGQAAILEEAINSWLKEFVPELIEKEASKAISLPRVEVKKAVPGNPIELALSIPLRPDLVLPDYKEIAKKINAKKEAPQGVAEKDVDEAILRLRKYAARAVNPQNKEEPKDDELPPLNDEFAKAVGGGQNVDELKKRISADLEKENQNKAREKTRLSIIEEISNKTTGALPDVLIDYEIERMESEFEGDVERMGLKLDDYLKQSGKTREDLLKDWRPSAQKRAKVNLILAEIKQKENIKPAEAEVEKEVDHVLEHHKDADRKNAKTYIERVLGNEKAFEWLENQN